ncbi:hypothetical protein IAD21_05021 [Abditibacteriota bacterium]|nr:hypothetical protein IAD21_05021 [Abditibacteriota bacterium]
MQPIHVWPQEVKAQGDFVTHSALIEDRDPYTLWFRVPAEHAGLLSKRAESFVASTVFLAMMRGANLRVHAPLSPSFLRNIEELQALWSCWHRDFHLISIEVDSESESTIQASQRAISMFSGGVDSCYTVWRHTQNRCGRRALPLQTALMLHGSEIPLENTELFERARQRSQNMLSAVGVELVPLATNSLSVMPGVHRLRWFSTMLTSSLLLFQESHTTGLVPSSLAYNELVLPHTLTPLNIPLYSTGRFAIEYDGAAFMRTKKMSEIVEWPEVLENLRVCNRPDSADVNCGRCEKCVRTILTLRIIGIQDPPCFPNTLSDADIEHIRMSGIALQEMNDVVEAAHAARVRASWLTAIEKSLHTNKRRARWEQHPLRRRILRRTPENIKSIWRAIKRRL